MGIDNYEPIAAGREKDPALFTAFVEFKLRHGVGKDEVVRQLIENKGMGREMAIPLVNSVAMRLEHEDSSKLIDISTFFFAVLTGSACSVLGLIVWWAAESYIPFKYGIGPGLCCLTIASGISLSAKKQTGVMTLIIGYAFVVCSIIFGELFIRDVFGYCDGFAPSGVSKSVLTTCIIGQFKNGILIDKIGIGVGLVLCFFLLGKKSGG